MSSLNTVSVVDLQSIMLSRWGKACSCRRKPRDITAVVDLGHGVQRGPAPYYSEMAMAVKPWPTSGKLSAVPQLVAHRRAQWVAAMVQALAIKPYR